MVSLHRVRSLESDSIGIYELVPDDDVFTQVGCEGVKTFGQSGYNAHLPW
jgi:hypothetical protein